MMHENSFKSRSMHTKDVLFRYANLVFAWLVTWICAKLDVPVVEMSAFRKFYKIWSADGDLWIAPFGFIGPFPISGNRIVIVWQHVVSFEVQNNGSCHCVMCTWYAGNVGHNRHFSMGWQIQLLHVNLALIQFWFVANFPNFWQRYWFDTQWSNNNMLFNWLVQRWTPNTIQWNPNASLWTRCVQPAKWFGILRSSAVALSLL